MTSEQSDYSLAVFRDKLYICDNGLYAKSKECLSGQTGKYAFIADIRNKN